jgi:hypothetical protein
MTYQFKPSERDYAIAAQTNALIVATAYRMKAKAELDWHEVKFWMRQEIRAENELRRLGIPMHGTCVPEDLPE